MARLPIELDPAAIREAIEAGAWYAQRSLATAEAFLAELDLALDRIGNHAERYARYLHGTHRYPLRRFPFSVVYRVAADKILVVAFAHMRRRPGYWRNRS